MPLKARLFRCECVPGGKYSQSSRGGITRIIGVKLRPFGIGLAVWRGGDWQIRYLGQIPFMEGE